MSNLVLSHSAIDLVLQLLEPPEPVISASAIALSEKCAAEELIAKNLLVPFGHEQVSSNRDDDDALASLSQAPNGRGLGYFDARCGWVSSAPEELIRYRLDLDLVLKQMLGALRPSLMPPRNIIEHVLWDAGTIRLGRRLTRPSLWIARRIHHRPVWDKVRTALRGQPASGTRLLIATTRSELLPDSPIRATLLASAADLFSSKTMSLDARLIAARLDSLPAQVEGAVVLVAGGKLVRLYEKTFDLPKGVQQRNVIAFLYERYREGVLLVSKDELAEAVELKPRTRLRDLFKGSPAWRQLLTERSGLCGFCLEENRDALRFE
jgi:hypothetical protein